MKNARIGWSLLLSALLAGGCAMPLNQARMVRSVEVENQIESAVVLPGHTYFYAGPEAAPDAIIAIDNSFALQSKYWIKVEAVEQQLKLWDRLLENDTRFVYAYEGFKILTPDGKQAGIWYSKYDYSVVRFPDPSTIILYAPLPRLKQKRPYLGRF